MNRHGGSPQNEAEGGGRGCGIVVRPRRVDSRRLSCRQLPRPAGPPDRSACAPCCPCCYESTLQQPVNSRCRPAAPRRLRVGVPPRRPAADPAEERRQEDGPQPVGSVGGGAPAAGGELPGGRWREGGTGRGRGAACVALQLSAHRACLVWLPQKAWRLWAAGAAGLCAGAPAASVTLLLTRGLPAVRLYPRAAAGRCAGAG